MKQVLFVCVGNAGRSQMAEAFFNRYAAQTQAISAGTAPAPRVSSTVIKAMDEIGINIADKKPKALTIEMLESADRVISMGCGVAETCPASFVPAEDWELDDPKDTTLDEVRHIRDEIKSKVKVLVHMLESAI